jgi:putative ABC transport system permease protein
MFKMIWHRKTRNLLLMSEIFFSFLVIFVVASMAFSSIAKYIKPRGFSHENVWVFFPGWRSMEDKLEDAEVRETLTRLQQELEAYNEIEKLSWTSFNYPYSHATIGTILEWQGQEIGVDHYRADDNFAEVLKMPIAAGRWFNREDDASAITPIVLNRDLKEKLYGSEPAVGQVYSDDDDDEYLIIGVVDNYRYHGDFEDHRGGFFRRNVLHDTAAGLPSIGLISVRDGVGVEFEERLLKRLSALAPGWGPRVTPMEDLRTTYMKDFMVGLIITGVIAGFLVFNVALGLFGVLWYSVSRRRREVGLRRAVGAHTGQVSGQILGEALVLATFAIIAGIFIAGQVPVLGLSELLTGKSDSISAYVYFLGMAFAAGLIYLIVSLCAVYPSRLAARIQPAEALHSD